MSEAIIEGWFPAIKASGYTITSPIDSFYNCAAYAAGVVDEWWDPYNPHVAYGARAEGADMTKALSTVDCATQLGMSDEFIRGEIRDQRLTARLLERASGRRVYRITPEDFDAYLAQYWRFTVNNPPSQPT